MLMMYVALFVLGGISAWDLRKRFKKVAAVVLVAGVGFSFFSIVSMGSMVGAWITEEDWVELRSIGKQLPENSIVTTSESGLFYWGSLLFDKELGSTFHPWWPGGLDRLAEWMNGMQKPGSMLLAVVRNDLIADENLESLGLEFYDNVWTEHYCVLKLAENSEGAQPRGTNEGEGPGGLPEYPGTTNLQWSKENIQENYFQGYVDLSHPEVSAAIYSTTENYTAVLQWYREQMLGLGWTKTWDEESSAGPWGTLSYTKGNDTAIIAASTSQTGSMLALVAGPASAFGEGPSGPGDQEGGGPFQEPTATSEIRFNHNPLFAFILLPIELVQGLYGTAVYGILKLVVAIPLSVGLIGFLVGLVPVIARKFRARRAIKQARIWRVWLKSHRS